MTSPQITVWLAEPDGDGRSCSGAERERASAFGDGSRGRRWLAARGFLRDVLGTTLGVPPAALEVVQDPGGKPRLADSSLDFNLAHTRGLVAVAVAGPGVGPVGVDIERPRRLHRPERLAARLCSGDEYDRWAARPPPERTVELLQRWTRVEALLKATGEGIRGGVAGAEARLRWWAVADLPPGTEVLGAVAARIGEWEVVVRDQTQSSGT